jgi:AmpD protein
MIKNDNFILNDGWISGVQRIESPNCDDRPAALVSMIVVHAISLPPSQFGSGDIARLFTNTLDPEAHPYFSNIHQLRVSAHFLIRRDGALIQFVSCLQRAWHAGTSCWNGRERCNDFSIGIELEGSDETVFEDAQYQQLVELIKQLCNSFPIDAVVGHSDISPGRKTDPGPFFDWRRLGDLRTNIAPVVRLETQLNKIS